MYTASMKSFPDNSYCLDIQGIQLLNKVYYSFLSQPAQTYCSPQAIYKTRNKKIVVDIPTVPEHNKCNLQIKRFNSQPL